MALTNLVLSNVLVMLLLNSIALLSISRVKGRAGKMILLFFLVLADLLYIYCFPQGR